MSIAEIEAVLLELPNDQLDELMDRVISQKVAIEDEIDPAVLAEAHRRLADMRSGRVTPVSFEQLLEDLDRLAS